DLTAEDGDPSQAGGVMLTDSVWHDRCGADPAVVDSVLTLDGQPYTVVGVLPREFVFPGWDAELVAALVPAADPRRDERGTNFLRAFARLAPRPTFPHAPSHVPPTTHLLPT